jgi:2-polyprenyl-3-methyl-5-hydroxy-6-metoxy-1,4-benzoquinol methylase
MGKISVNTEPELASNEYGDQIAEEYDHLYGDFNPYPGQISKIVSEGQNGLVVEVGSGTGRIAIPVAKRGVRIMAIDASSEMTRIALKRAANAGVCIDAETQTAEELCTKEQARLIYSVFNTYFLLGSAEKQQSFLGRAAAALLPGGALILETFVPHCGTLPDGPFPGDFPSKTSVTIKRQEVDFLVLFAAQNKPDRQEFSYQEVVLRDGELPRLFPGHMKYCWPEEIDAMAGRAGLKLRSRASDWLGTPYTSESRKQVSTYVKQSS